MKHKVMIGSDNRMYGLAGVFFRPGDRIYFKVEFPTDVNTYVTSADASVEQEKVEGFTGYYSFIMPEHDVKVDITHSGGMTAFRPRVAPPVEYKKCPACGAEIEKQFKFCTHCGTKQPTENRCPTCGAEAVPGKKFCPECGTRL